MAKTKDLQTIVSEYYAALYRFGLALAKNESEAADLTQQTFLILAEHQEQIREPERIKCWLFTTRRREFLRKLRIHTAHPEVEFQPEETRGPSNRAKRASLYRCQERIGCSSDGRRK